MKNVRVQVLTTATQLVPEAATSARGDIGYPTAAIIRNPSTGSTIYLGGPAVDTTTGWPMAAGEDLEIDLVGDILWGVVSASSTYAYILRRD